MSVFSAVKPIWDVVSPSAPTLLPLAILSATTQAIPDDVTAFVRCRIAVLFLAIGLVISAGLGWLLDADGNFNYGSSPGDGFLKTLATAASMCEVLGSMSLFAGLFILVAINSDLLEEDDGGRSPWHHDNSYIAASCLIVVGILFIAVRLLLVKWRAAEKTKKMDDKKKEEAIALNEATVYDHVYATEAAAALALTEASVASAAFASARCSLAEAERQSKLAHAKPAAPPVEEEEGEGEAPAKEAPEEEKRVDACKKVTEAANNVRIKFGNIETAVAKAHKALIQAKRSLQAANDALEKMQDDPKQHVSELTPPQGLKMAASEACNRARMRTSEAAAAISRTQALIRASVATGPGSTTTTTALLKLVADAEAAERHADPNAVLVV